MKIHKCILSNKTKDTYVQVYLTEQECKNKDVINEIKRLKEKSYKIAYFISGQKNYPEILKNIIFFEVGKNDIS